MITRADDLKGLSQAEIEALKRKAELDLKDAYHDLRALIAERGSVKPSGLDVLSLAESAADDIDDTDVSSDADDEAYERFIEAGPYSLDELIVPRADRDGLVSRDHRIAEIDARNLNDIERDIQKSRNVVQLPIALKQEIDAVYNQICDFDGRPASLRDFLKSQSFMTRYRYGLEVLRWVGALK